ncbi:MAG: pantetheine-phosphate adenylyltransferase [Lautropia sp.]|nr:pantetheine-phosphate adenylyltransferase [Lautropia sp.]
MTKVIYPGTFDPMTIGHQDIVQRIAGRYDALVVAVSNSRRNTLFSLDERLSMARCLLADHANVTVLPFEGLVTDFAREVGASLIVRGLRDASDFDYERRMASLNRVLQPGIDTLFMIPDDRHQSITGTLVREIAMMGGDVSAFVGPVVLEGLKRKRQERA